MVALTYLLSNQSITLLDPKSWDDMNDSYYVSLYKTKKSLKTVLALCFVQSPETYQHWRVFAGNSCGVCIRFDRKKLINAIEKQVGITFGQVKYHTLKNIQSSRPRISKLPFMKRFAFKDENEFRIIYESQAKILSKLDIPISFSCIDNITISPWAHASFFESMKKLLKSINGCDKLKITRSTIINNEEWKNIGEVAV